MLTTRTYVAVAASVVALAVIGFAVVTFLLPQGTTIDPDNRVKVAAGGQVYAEHCARCHGANLEGQPNWKDRQPNGRLPAPPHDVTGHTWHHPDQQLMLITKKSLSAVVPGYESDMPAFESVLTDEQIAAVLSFIESSWPPDIRERQRALTRQAS